MNINVIYGILTGGTVSSDSPGYRYTNYTGTEKQRKAVDALLIEIPVNMRGAAANFMLQLMRTDERWSEFLDLYDPYNTYATKYTFCKDDNISGLLDKLVTWTDNNTIRTTEYTVDERDLPFVRVCNQLFSLIRIGN